jgi:hypothetical protein
MRYFEVSAKIGTGLEEAFVEFVTLPPVPHVDSGKPWVVANGDSTESSALAELAELRAENTRLREMLAAGAEHQECYDFERTLAAQLSAATREIARLHGLLEKGA